VRPTTLLIKKMGNRYRRILKNKTLDTGGLGGVINRRLCVGVEHCGHHPETVGRSVWAGKLDQHRAGGGREAAILFNTCTATVKSADALHSQRIVYDYKIPSRSQTASAGEKNHLAITVRTISGKGFDNKIFNRSTALGT